MKIAIIGTGYIGLVSGVCLAHIGHDVVCVDSNREKIDLLRRGIVPIFEKGLDHLLQSVLTNNRLKFETDVVQATCQSDCIMIAVGTPTAADGASSDLSYLYNAAREIAQGIDAYKTVIVKSTVPVGTSASLRQVILQVNPSADFEIASNPEFLKEGVAVDDFMNPDRIVIGAEGSRSLAALEKIYRYFSDRDCQFLFTNLETAELVKFASNGFLATKIAFINEMAELCEATGAELKDVARGMGLDDRIGAKFLNAGPGFGGSCFPKDIRALCHMARAVDVELGITEAVSKSNETAKLRAVQKIVELAGGSVKGLKIAVFGVTFKPDTDDMREAPALSILPSLIDMEAIVVAVDPEGRKYGETLLQGVTWEEDPYAAAHGADMIVVLTEWSLFKALDLRVLKSDMKQAMMADFRNIYSQQALVMAGFHRYYQIGRGIVTIS